MMPTCSSSITLCIVLNTVFMAADHAGMSEHLAHVLTIGNYVRTSSSVGACAVGGHGAYPPSYKLPQNVLMYQMFKAHI